jgi:hypothetical protein
MKTPEYTASVLPEMRVAEKATLSLSFGPNLEHSYTYDIHCSNCTRRDRIWIKRGVPIKHIIGEVECRTCGCKVDK